MNFWLTLPKPFTVLAPMEDVTDTVFRQIVASCCRPDVFFTEFTNVEGMLSEEGSPKVSQRLVFSQTEHPIVAQIWGTKPESFTKAAQMLVRLGFDGVDINMGCPEKSVTSHGGGAALIGAYDLAADIIKATRKGAGALPVSLKTRIGKNTIITDEWISFLLKQKLDAITIHARTAKEKSDVPARWDEIKKAVDMRNNGKFETVIIGNGDVASYEDVVKKAATSGADGVMIGRGVFQDMWVFSKDRHVASVKESLELLLRHLNLFDTTWGDTKHYPIMKKFYKIYVRDFDGASDFRSKLMETTNAQEAIDLVNKYYKKSFVS